MNVEQLIATKLRKKHEIERASHISSGKLSASQLSKPLLEQVLKIIGVPEAPTSDYSLRLFERGNQVEAWVVDQIADEKAELQVEIDYKGVVGFVDFVKDGMPYEVKSVKGSQWKWLQKEGIRWSHKLQAGLYGLALKSEQAQVVYVCADDFRIMQCALVVDTVKPEIEKIMGEVKQALKSATLPEFKARESWHDKPEYGEKYSSYGEWLQLPTELAMEKLKRDYSKSYERLIKLSKGVK